MNQHQYLSVLRQLVSVGHCIPEKVTITHGYYQNNHPFYNTQDKFWNSILLIKSNYTDTIPVLRLSNVEMQPDLYPPNFA